MQWVSNGRGFRLLGFVEEEERTTEHPHLYLRFGSKQASKTLIHPAQVKGR